MPKKGGFSKKGLASFVSTVKGKIPSHPIVDTAVGVGSGYLANRLISSGAVAVTNKTSLAPYSAYVGSAASVLSIFLTWLVSDHVESIKKYQAALIAGSILAAVQQIILSHIPGLSWLAAPPVSLLFQASGTNGAGGYREDTGGEPMYEPVGDANTDTAYPQLPPSYEAADDEDFAPLPGAMQDIA